MSDEERETVSPAGSSQAWLSRLGRSGQVLAVGAIVGIVSTFLPLVSLSVAMMGMAQVNQSAMVVQDWRGMLCLLGYVAALTLVFVLYPPNGLAQKSIAWVGLGVGAALVLLSVWLLVLALNTGELNLGNAAMMGMGDVRASPGIGVFVNVAAAAAVLVGGFLKAREERLV